MPLYYFWAPQLHTRDHAICSSINSSLINLWSSPIYRLALKMKMVGNLLKVRHAFLTNTLDIGIIFIHFYFQMSLFWNGELSFLFHKLHLYQFSVYHRSFFSSNHDMWVFKMLDIVVRQIGHCLRDEQQLWQQTKWPHGTIVTSLSLFRQILQIDICSALSNSSIISDKMSFSSSPSLALSISTIAAFCVDNKEVLCEVLASPFSSIYFAVGGGFEKSRSLLVHCLLFG